MIIDTAGNLYGLTTDGPPSLNYGRYSLRNVAIW